MNETKDLIITCKLCGDDFVWTEGEQEFYKEKGLYPPKHCQLCRIKKKQKENQ